MDVATIKRAVMNQLADFQKAEVGNRIAPYNMAGLMSAMGAVLDQFEQPKQAEAEADK